MPISLLSKRALRILVTRTDRIGDLVLSTPIFSSLRKAYPKAHIACLTFSENREIIEGNPFLDEVILYDKKGSERGILGNILFSRRIAKKKFDIVIHLHATNRMHWMSFLAGIPVRIGYDRKCKWALTNALKDQKSEGQKHEAEYNFDLLETLNVSCPSSLETYFPVSENSLRSFHQLLKHHNIKRLNNWVVINPSASCPSKRWSAAFFGELFRRRIKEDYDVTFILIGTLADRQLTQQVSAAAQIPIYDLSGKLSLGMLGALLAESKLLISNDSGPVHIATALKTPVISVFGRNQAGLSPNRWKPLGNLSKILWKDVGCQKCLAHNCEINFLCLEAVSVEDALEAVKGFSNRFHPEPVTQ